MITQIITEVSLITHINGVAKIRLPDGALKELKAGDTLQPGAVVILDEGVQLTLKNEDTKAEHQDSPQTAVTDVVTADNSTSNDIVQLQQSILEGADPTKAFEAAATGATVEAGTGAGSGNGGFVSIVRSGDATIAEAGYDTTAVVSSTSDLSVAEPVTASTSEIDSTPPTITVDAPALTNDRTPTITGITDLPVGSTISLTVTDSAGAQQTFTTTVQIGGTYSVDVPSTLVEGDYSVTATATDAAGNSANATDSGIFAEDDAVDAVNDSVSMNEDGSVTLALLSNDSAADGGLQVTHINGVAVTGGVQRIAVSNGTVLIAADGAMTFEPADDFNGEINFGYQVKDADGDIDSASVKVTVTAQDDAVDAVNDSVSMNEDGSVTLALLSNDSAADGGLQVTHINGVAVTGGVQHIAVSNGTVLIAADGAMTFEPADDFNGEINFGYQVKDADGDIDSASVKVTVTAQDDAVDAVNDSVSMNEDGSVTLALLSNDSAADGGLQVTHINGVAVTGGVQRIAVSNGTVLIAADGAMTFEPADDFNGEINFGYQVKDADGDIDSASVKVTVTAQDDAVDAVNDSVSMNEDGSVTLALLSNDSAADGGLQVTHINGVAVTGGVQRIAVSNGTVLIAADGAMTFEPADDFNGEINFGYQVKDADGDIDSATLTINVAAVNDSPTVNSTPITVTGTEDKSYIFTWDKFGVSDVDSYPTSLGVKITSFPNEGKLEYQNLAGNWVAVTLNQTITYSDITAGHLRFAPDTNESGDSSFSTNGIGNMKADYASFAFVATDGDKTSSSATMTVDINPVANTPVIKLDGVSVLNGSAYVVAPNSDGLTVRSYAAISQVDTTTVDTTAEVSTLLSRLNANTPTYTSISTAPQNYIDSTTGGSPYGISTDGAYRITGLIYFEAGKTYTFSSYMDDTAVLKIGGTEVLNMTYNHWGNIVATTYTPIVSGYYTLDWAVYNGHGVGALKPTLSVNGGTALALNTTNYNIYSSLEALDSLNAVHGSLVSVSGNEGYYPVYNLGVEDTAIKLSSISVGVSDTDGSEKIVSLLVSDLKAGTVLSDGLHEFVATNTTTSVDITAWNLSSLYITPPHNYTGTYNIGFVLTSEEISTHAQATNSITLPIVVTAVNDAPVALPDNSASVKEDSGAYIVTGSVLQNDSDLDGNTLTVTLVNGLVSVPAAGSTVAGTYGSFVMSASGQYTYTLDNSNAAVNVLNNGQTLTDSITYTISDGHGGTDSAVLTVTINGATDSVTPTVNTSNKDDLVSGRSGNDTISAKDGNDIVYGNEGNDTLNGGNGNDYLSGGEDNDSLEGDADNDYLSGGLGNDTLNGGSGNDRLDGGDGDNDTLTGGIGSDVFVWAADDAGALGASLAGTNTYGVATSIYLANTVDKITDFIKGEDSLDLRGLLIGEVHTGETDTGNLSNYLHIEATTAANNTISTVIHISTTGGFDQGYVSSAEDQTIILTGVDFTTDGLASNLDDKTIISYLLKNSYLTVDDGAGNDIFTGTNHGDTLHGMSGNDVLYSGLGNDILFGDSGDDYLYGQAGNDRLTGGTGNDHFVWSDGEKGTITSPVTDTITDFDKSSDVIDISDLLDHTTTETADVLKNYLSISSDNNSNLTIQIHESANGTNDVTNTIVLDGVHNSDFGVGTTMTTILNTLIDSQHLLIDKH